MILLAGTALRTYTTQPTSLDQVRLVGIRHEDIDVILLLDVSGSFTSYQPIRDDALESLFRWAPHNLRPADTLTVIEFADGATLAQPTTPINRLDPTGATHLIRHTQIGDSLIQPALDMAEQSVPSSSRPRAIITISDTLMSDLDGLAIEKRLRTLRVDTTTLIVPQFVRVRQEWHRCFPDELVVRARQDSAGTTSVGMARALAHATGQDLHTR